MITGLLCVVKEYPQFSADVAPILLDIGEAICATATYEEISLLIKGTLSPKDHVRNLCLQSLQVQFSDENLGSCS